MAGPAGWGAAARSRAGRGRGRPLAAPGLARAVACTCPGAGDAAGGGGGQEWAAGGPGGGGQEWAAGERGWTGAQAPERAPVPVLVLAAADPANAYGAALPWPERSAENSGGHRPGRKAGAL